MTGCESSKVSSTQCYSRNMVWQWSMRNLMMELVEEGGR